MEDTFSTVGKVVQEVNLVSAIFDFRDWHKGIIAYQAVSAISLEVGFALCFTASNPIGGQAGGGVWNWRRFGFFWRKNHWEGFVCRGFCRRERAEKKKEN